MKAIKHYTFNTQQVRLSQLAKALGHPARIAILEVLMQRNTCICGDIVDELPLSQATVSQHLKALKEAGIIRGTIDGPRTCYCINVETWNEVKEAFAGWFEKMPACGPDCC